MSHMDFSSWPREQEQSFVVYEQRNSESSKKAFTIAGAIAAVWFFALIGIYMGVAPEHKDMTKGMNMDNLTKKSKYESKDTKDKAETPAPAPKAEAPAAAPAAPAPAAAEEKKE